MTTLESGLEERVVRFARLLRGAGLRLGPAQTVEGLSALTVVDVTRRDDVFHTLSATWVRRHEDHELFREAFRLFWREPDRPVNRVLEELLALSRLTPRRPPAHTRRRIFDAMDRQRPGATLPSEEEPLRLASSDHEVLRAKDFEQMSAQELADAARMVKRLRMPARHLITRRWEIAAQSGEVDLRRTMTRSLRRGYDAGPLQRRRRRSRPPAIVALCDISGSMSGYTRMLLRFLHALTNDRDRTHTFLFGTRLSNISRDLRGRDPDVALAEVGQRVRDWEGGTRIGECLRAFNLEWSRRVLAQGAVVLLITDGLERGDPSVLSHEMGRLHRSARKLIWLNPLLRFADFRPEAAGIQAMLPHVDDFRAAHNLVSLESLSVALSGPAQNRSWA